MLRDEGFKPAGSSQPCARRWLVRGPGGAVAVVLCATVALSLMVGANGRSKDLPAAEAPAHRPPQPGDAPITPAAPPLPPAGLPASPAVMLPKVPLLEPNPPAGAPRLPAVMADLPPIIVDPDQVKPAAARQPVIKTPKDAKDPGPAPLPKVNPNPNPVADERVRLRPAPPGLLGATPVPTPQVLEEQQRFIQEVIDPGNTLDLISGRARLIILKQPPIRTQVVDVSVAEFNLVDADTKGLQLTILGKRVGTTVLNLWFTDPANKDRERVLSYLVRVFPDPEEKTRLEAVYKVLENEINKAFPNSRIRLTLVGDKLMVSGQAHDIYEATQILRLLQANAPGALPTASLRAGGGPIAPAGGAAPAGPLDPLRPTDTPGLENYLAAGGNAVINNLRIPGEQQIMLRVVVAEVNRAAARSIGLNFSITNNRGIQVFSQNTGGLVGTGNLPLILDNGQIPVALNALRTLSYARSLAEPNLTTLNGQPASFLSGGQFPIPVLGGLGGGIGALQGVQFVPFGVQLQFTPTMTDRDRIRLSLNATVSTRDPSIGAAGAAGLNTRTFQTTVELREGQTMAVAGLVSNNIGANASRVPFFGDIPYFGRLASAHQTSSGEQELIVLVTPELVHPLEPHELSPLPGADLFEPGDIEFYLTGRLESRRSYDYRAAAMTDIHRMLRYRRCEQTYIVGPSGHVDPPAPNAGAPAGKK